MVAAAATQAAQALPPPDWNLALGNPSNATPSPLSRTNYLMVKPFFALSYNDDKGTPNWVSWHLSPDYLGDAPRKNRFDPDTSLPSGFRRIIHNDYNGSGFDRGHMCPHGDRAASRDMSYATFVMTNIVPQTHENNAGAWEAREEYERDLAKNRHKDLFIVSGPIGQGGTSWSGPAQTIASGKVVVPKAVFEVILAVDRVNGAQPAQWVKPNSRLIAVIMPNDTSVPETDWARYRTTVANVEAQTGYTFFSAAPAAILGPKKQQVDTTPIAGVKPRRYGRHGR